jgi:hypothetical protein
MDQQPVGLDLRHLEVVRNQGSHGGVHDFLFRRPGTPYFLTHSRAMRAVLPPLANMAFIWALDRNGIAILQNRVIARPMKANKRPLVRFGDDHVRVLGQGRAGDWATADGAAHHAIPQFGCGLPNSSMQT